MGILNKFKSTLKKSKKPSQAKTAESKKPVKKIEPSEKKVKSSVVPQQRSTGKKDLREVYKILKEPHISEKSTHLSDERKYTFKVYSSANKFEIKKAISGLYSVRVKNVNIINIKPKKRLLRGLEGTKAGYKKAIVTLEKGEKIEILPH